MTKQTIPTEIVNQVFALPANERYELAQHLLDTIDNAAAAEFDEQFIAELHRRRDEMLGGKETLTDWRGAVSGIESSLTSGDRK